MSKNFDLKQNGNWGRDWDKCCENICFHEFYMKVETLYDYTVIILL